jgi:ribonuclease HII
MDEFDEKYPAYGFKQHKGYGTNHHFHMLNEHGICSLHRKSFEPIKYFTNSQF